MVDLFHVEAHISPTRLRGRILLENTDKINIIPLRSLTSRALKTTVGTATVPRIPQGDNCRVRCLCKVQASLWGHLLLRHYTAYQWISMTPVWLHGPKETCEKRACPVAVNTAWTKTKTHFVENKAKAESKVFQFSETISRIWLKVIACGICVTACPFRGLIETLLAFSISFPWRIGYIAPMFYCVETGPEFQKQNQSNLTELLLRFHSRCLVKVVLAVSVDAKTFSFLLWIEMCYNLCSRTLLQRTRRHSNFFFFFTNLYVERMCSV